MKREEIVAKAREFVGTPYQLNARIQGVAIDCAGIPLEIARSFGLPVEQYLKDGRTPSPIQMRAELDKHLLRVSRADMQLGDVAWLRIRDGVEPQHLAIVGDYKVGGGFTLIHAYNRSGLNKVVEHRIDETWAARIVGVWQLPGVEE
jgi:hypothetical protein